MNSISVIIPCYNEELVIKECYLRLKLVLNTLQVKHEIIFINDGSSDRTALILDNFAANDKRTKIIHFSRNFGHQPAVMAGINHSCSDVAVIIDADLQDPPELIPQILETLIDNDANVVYCVRKSREGESLFKKITAKMFYRVLNSLSDVTLPLDTGDFRAIDRQVIDELKSLREKNKYIRGLISWIGFKQVPFYYARDSRLNGETKYPFTKMIRFASNALISFSLKPLKWATIMGFISCSVGFILGLLFLCGKVFGFIYSETGWTSLVIMIIFFGGVQLLTIGVLGQYLGVVLNEVKNRPEYVISRINNI
ncbi:MAG: glycosyltransferase family 2 protein [Tannerellaceae bacterium]